MLLSNTVYAETVIDSKTYYFVAKDVYRVDYTPRSGVSWYQLYFTSPSGAVYTGNYNMQPTGLHWLTCNGTYYLKFFDASNSLIYITQKIVTTQIQNPTCSSYSGSASGQNDLNARYTDKGNGSFQVGWEPANGSTQYEIYKDGQLLQTTNGTNFTMNGQGSVSIVGKDANGNVVSESDLNVTNCTEECQRIKDALSCPDWPKYMGEWSDMIKRSLPPPPDWQEVANIMRDTIVPAAAKAIGDDLESREKPVSPPNPLPEFNPIVPTLTDLPTKIDTDLTQNIPSFDPDFSQSSPFVIPEPNINDLGETDKQGGYQYQTPTFNAPSYNKKSPTIEPDKGYHGAQIGDVTGSPSYRNSNTTATQPNKQYHNGNVTETTPPPNYQNHNYTESTPHPNYTITNPAGNGSAPPPEYQQSRGRD